MRYGYDVCAVCGAPVLSVTSGHPLWLSKCRAVVDGAGGLVSHVSKPGYYEAGNIKAGDQFYTVDWSLYHANNDTIRTYSLARPAYPVHDACWKMMCQVVPETVLPCVTKFFRENWQENHELFYYYRRRQPKAKQVVTCSTLSDAGSLDFGERVDGRYAAENCDYLTRLAGVQLSWLGFEYDEVFLTDPAAVPPVILSSTTTSSSGVPDNELSVSAAPAVSAVSAAPVDSKLSVSAAPATHPDLRTSLSQIERLPAEVLENILTATDLRSVLSFLSTSKHTHCLSLSPAFWRQQCVAQLPFLKWDKVVLSTSSFDVDWKATLFASLASPHIRNGLRIWNIVHYIKQELCPVRWDMDALRPLNTLPLRLRPQVRRLIEMSAREANVSLVTRAFYYEAADRGNLVALLTGRA